MAVGSNETISRIFDTFAVISKSRYCVVYDIYNHYARWSANAVAYFGLPGEYVSDADKVWEEKIHPEDRENFRLRLQNLQLGIAQEKSFEYRARSRSGEYVACSSKGTIIKDYSGKPAYLAFSIINHGIVSGTDPITKADNLYEFYNTLRSKKDKKQEVIVLLLDAIRFGDINRTYGYTFGNDVLRAMASLLINLTANQGTVYRADGTCLVFLTDRMSMEEVRKLYARLRTEMRNAFYVAGRKISVAIAGSLVLADHFDLDEHVTYTNARCALEISKEESNGGLILYHNEERGKDNRQIDLMDAIRSDIAEHFSGFYLCYQPVVSVQDDKIIGAEVLLRWKKEPFGEVMPDEFIPWFENDPCFFELGNWILETACSECKSIVWKEREFLLGINLNYMQLERSEFRTALLQIMRRTGFQGKNLMLELTKKCRQMSREHLKSQMDFLKACGCKIAVDVDDFAALDLLDWLPVDGIKLDRKFAREAEKSQVDQYKIEAIIEFARHMNISVTITGIEHADKMNFFRTKYQMDTFQGYYYSKPVRIRDMEKMLNI